MKGIQKILNQKPLTREDGYVMIKFYRDELSELQTTLRLGLPEGTGICKNCNYSIKYHRDKSVNCKKYESSEPSKCSHLGKASGGYCPTCVHLNSLD